MSEEKLKLNLITFAYVAANHVIKLVTTSWMRLMAKYWMIKIRKRNLPRKSYKSWKRSKK